MVFTTSFTSGYSYCQVFGLAEATFGCFGRIIDRLAMICTVIKDGRIQFENKGFDKVSIDHFISNP